MTQHKSLNQTAWSNRLINRDKSEYYRNLISENSNDSRKLWQALRKALHTVPETTFPTHKCDKTLADRFASFFCEKIQKLQDMFPATGSAFVSPCMVPPEFTQFCPVSETKFLKL